MPRQDERCACPECRTLDRQFPKEGHQLRLSMTTPKPTRTPKRPRVRKIEMQQAQPTPGRLLNISEVEHETSLHRATIYRRIAAGKFPEKIKLGERRVAWPQAAIETWKAEQIAAAI